MYGYRSVAERLRNKVRRAYRRANLPANWDEREYEVARANARSLPFSDNSADLVVTSPPYYDALDYARDNRLRLWFLGRHDWKALNRRLTPTNTKYEGHMAECLREMYRILKPGRFCVLVVGEVQRDGSTKDTATVLGQLARRVTAGALDVDCVIEDGIPDARRSRRGTKTTRVEKILVLGKTMRSQILKPGRRHAVTLQ